MPHPQSSWPFERPEQLTDALREQGASPEECADLLPALRRLSEWQAPQPSPADTRRLLARLTAELPVSSPVRQAIHEHRQHRVAFLLATAHAQVSLFGLAFWLVSALITLLGAAVVLSNVLPDQEVVLRASGPLLAYLGTIVAFRGRGARVLELELVCLPLPLVAGLALLLTLRLSVQAAASLAYGSWLAFLAISSTTNLQVLLLTPALLVLPGCIGLALLAIALLRIHTDMHRLLPHA